VIQLSVIAALSLDVPVVTVEGGHLTLKLHMSASVAHRDFYSGIFPPEYSRLISTTYRIVRACSSTELHIIGSLGTFNVQHSCTVSHPFSAFSVAVPAIPQHWILYFAKWRDERKSRFSLLDYF